MASCNFRKPAAGASVLRHMAANWLCCLMILVIAVMKGTCATTVLHNKSGRDLVLIIPQHHLNIEVPEGESVELEQPRGVVIQDVKTGAVSGPLNLPDSPSLDLVPLNHPSTYSTAASLDIQISGTLQLSARSTSFGLRINVGHRR